LGEGYSDGKFQDSVPNGKSIPVDALDNVGRNHDTDSYFFKHKLTDKSIERIDAEFIRDALLTFDVRAPLYSTLVGTNYIRRPVLDVMDQLGKLSEFFTPQEIDDNEQKHEMFLPEIRKDTGKQIQTAKDKLDAMMETKRLTAEAHKKALAKAALLAPKPPVYDPYKPSGKMGALSPQMFARLKEENGQYNPYNVPLNGGLNFSRKKKKKKLYYS